MNSENCHESNCKSVFMFILDFPHNCKDYTMNSHKILIPTLTNMQCEVITYHQVTSYYIK